MPAASIYVLREVSRLDRRSRGRQASASAIAVGCRDVNIMIGRWISILFSELPDIIQSEIAKSAGILASIEASSARKILRKPAILIERNAAGGPKCWFLKAFGKGNRSS